MRFTPSAYRHGISEEDAKHAVLHSVGRAELVARYPSIKSFMMVGKPHPQARHYLEVGVGMSAQGEFYIFHAMEVTDLYRYLIPREDS